MTEGPVFGLAAPQFVVADVESTAHYYCDVLGFEITDRFLDPPVHMIVTRGYVQIFLAQARGESSVSNRRLLDVGIDAYIRVWGVRALADEFRSRGATILEGPVIRVYEQEELVVEDCNGFVLVFGEDTPPN
ncbi:MAG: VOC family protein [Acidobacteriota bacterium]